MTATDLTFIVSAPTVGLRHWDLRGPAGLIRFETADALGFKTSSVYLHAAVAPGGGELEDCDVCGRCWRDRMPARDLRADWEGAACHDAVIRTQLEKWYVENLAAWAADAGQSDEDQVVPARNLPMLLAEYAPNLPYLALADLARGLLQAGYQIVKAGGRS